MGKKSNFQKNISDLYIKKDFYGTNCRREEHSFFIKIWETIIRRKKPIDTKINQAEKIVNFIKDIYNTPCMNSVDTSKIEKVKTFIFEKFIPVIDRANIYEDEFDFFEKIKEGYHRWENVTKKSWLNDKVVISLLGRFSSGKSSIVNSLLGESLLPVDITPSTAIPTYISFTPQMEPTCKVEDYDGDIKEISLEQFRKISYVDFRDFPLSSFIRHICVEYNNENLKEKSILDTPGYDSLNEKDKRKTIEAIRESDVILWVMDINDGTLSNDVIKFIKECIIKDDNPLYIIINKADKKSPGERKRTLNEVQDQLRRSEINFEECFLYSTMTDEYKSNLVSLIKTIQKKPKKSFTDQIKDCFELTFNEINSKYMLLKKKLLNPKTKYNRDLIELELRRYDKLRSKLRELKDEFENI